MKKQLTLDALAMAYWRRKPPAGLLHHSDRGSQYTCHDYRKWLQQYDMVVSMRRKGNCWDNGAPRTFFPESEIGTVVILQVCYETICVDIKYIQNQLGHSSPTVTLNVYAEMIQRYVKYQRVKEQRVNKQRSLF